MIDLLRLASWTIKLEHERLLRRHMVGVTVLGWLLGLLLAASRVQQCRRVPSRGSEAWRAVGGQRRIWRVPTCGDAG